MYVEYKLDDGSHTTPFGIDMPDTLDQRVAMRAIADHVKKWFALNPPYRITVWVNGGDPETWESYVSLRRVNG